MKRFPPVDRILAERIAACGACPRLASYLAALRLEQPLWWNRPVPGFGDRKARLLVLGLAPGRAGANRTGRPFTGDAAGVWLYRALHALGLCSRSEAANPADGTRLRGVYVTNALKCVPPRNLPAAAELVACRGHLASELARLEALKAVLVLGGVAHGAFSALLAASPRPPAFGHGAEGEVVLGGRPLALVCSYHPSRLNTNTRRLTWDHWEEALALAALRAGLEA